MTRTLQQTNTRILMRWLPLVMLAGCVLLYFLMRGHILHLQDQQLHLKQRHIWRAFTNNAAGLALHIPGEYDIVPDPAPSAPVSDRPRDTVLQTPGYPPETFNLLTSRLTTGDRSYLVTTYISSKEVTHLIIKIAAADALIFLALLAAVIIVNRRTSRRLWSPFYTIMDRLRQYDIRQNQKIDLSSVTNIEEFDRLSQTLTALIDKVHAAYQGQKQFTENAAHELQTPLAIIRTKLELLSEGPGLDEEMARLLGEISDANERLSQMNRNLLLLSRIENHQFPGNESVSLSELVGKRTAFFADYFEEQVPDTRIDIAPGVQLTANASLIEILVNNLLRNAFIHNNPGGYVHVFLNHTGLLIENSGPPIEGDPMRLFDRFRKGRVDSRSTGLGLSLVHQIGQLYDFDIRYSYHLNIHQLRVTFTT